METRRRVPLPTMPRHQVEQDPGGDHRLAPPAAQWRSQVRSPQQTSTRKTPPRERPRKGSARPHAIPSTPRRKVATTKVVASTVYPSQQRRNMASPQAVPPVHLKEHPHNPWCVNHNGIGTWDAPAHRNMGCTPELAYNATGSAGIAGQPRQHTHHALRASCTIE